MKYADKIEKLKGSGQFHVALNSLPRQLVLPKTFHEEFLPERSFDSNKYEVATMLVENEAEYMYYLQYINVLEKHFKVDIYSLNGSVDKCFPVNFNGKTSAHFLADESSATKCEDVLQNYKFVVLPSSAFEDNYVTDRLRLAYKHNVVPVLFDVTNDYIGILPNSSYINIFSHDTPEALAQHLADLDKDSVAYNKYFEWTENYELYETIIDDEVCKLCRYIRELDRLRRFKYEEAE